MLELNKVISDARNIKTFFRDEGIEVVEHVVVSENNLQVSKQLVEALEGFLSNPSAYYSSEHNGTLKMDLSTIAEYNKRNDIVKKNSAEKKSSNSRFKIVVKKKKNPYFEKTSRTLFTEPQVKVDGNDILYDTELNEKAFDALYETNAGENLESMVEDQPFILSFTPKDRVKGALRLLSKNELEEVIEGSFKENIHQLITARYEALRQDIQTNHEYLYQVASGHSIMSLGGLIVHDLREDNKSLMIKNFSHQESIPESEVKKLFDAYLEDRYIEESIIKKLNKLRLNPVSINSYIQGFKNDVFAMLALADKLRQIRSDEKYANIMKYHNVRNYNQFFFDGELYKNEPRYPYGRSISYR